MALRTVTAYWRELKAEDPNCAIGLSYLRTAVATGLIPSFQVGRRRVIESDTAKAYLLASGKEVAHQPGGVRRIDP